MILGSVEGTTLGFNDGRFNGVQLEAVDGCRLGNGEGSIDGEFDGG